MATATENQDQSPLHGHDEQDAQDAQNVSHIPGPDPTVTLQVDPHADSDNDSAFGGDSIQTSSASLTSSIQNYKYENGRRYHAFREGEYPLPNDEQEQARMDLHHYVFVLSLNGALHRAPLPSNPHRVLDMGTGTGIWSIEFADQYPSAIVTGNDLSPIQPRWVPPNCQFFVDDLESDWIYTSAEAFDYIHGRGLGGSVKDWRRLYQNAYDNLKPGGWMEMQEYEAWIKSVDDPELHGAQSVAQWQQLVDEASLKFGKRINVAESQKQWIIDAGFENVRDDIYKVPIGLWPKDPQQKTLGWYQLEQMCECIEPFTLAPLTRYLGWSKEETQVLMAGVRSDFRNRKNHLYCNFHYVYGQKPMATN